MRFATATTTRAIYAFVLPLTLAPLAGCQKLTPNGTPDTIAMLRQGSEQICVSSEVQHLLHALIVPKPDEVEAANDVASQDVQAAIAAVPISFDATTLQSTDKSVSKASCTTNVSVSGADDQTRTFRLAYDVSPGAEDPNHVVVTADTGDVKAFIRSFVASRLATQQAAKEQDAQAAQEAQAREQLLATVTPKWLAGVWIGTGEDAANCGNGQGMTFQPDHRMASTALTGQWTLAQDHLHAVGQGANGAAEIDGTITTADPLSFTLTKTDGNTVNLRRCTREEIQSYGSGGQPDSFAPTPPAQN